MTTPTPDEKNFLGGKTMKAIQINGKIYVEEPDVRHAINAALATNKARNDRIAHIESDLAAKDAELASVKAHAEAMAEVLGWLNRLGGLGLDKHAQIEKVLVAYRTAHPKDAP